MASFNRLLTPLGRHHRVAVASMCTALFILSPFTPSLSPPTALAFSHQHVAATGGPPTSVISALSPSLFLQTPRRGSLDHYQNYHKKAFQSTNIGHPRPSLTLHSLKPKKYDFDLTALPSDSADEGAPSKDSPTKKSSSLKQDLQSTGILVGAQAVLILISYFLGQMLNVPNNGLGVGFEWTSSAAIQGIRWTFPLFAVAGIMQLIEPYSKSLQDVTKATQRSVLAVMGKERRPVFALAVSILLGAVAGLGEEWLFRGIL